MKLPIKDIVYGLPAVPLVERRRVADAIKPGGCLRARKVTNSWEEVPKCGRELCLASFWNHPRPPSKLGRADSTIINVTLPAA